MIFLDQPITMIRPYLINVHTELNNCSTTEQMTNFRSRTEQFTPEETEVLVWEVHAQHDIIFDRIRCCFEGTNLHIELLRILLIL